MSRSAAEMQALSERNASLVRAYNVREGASRADDTLPARAFEPELRGRGEGRALTPEMLDVMIDEYYTLRGWDHDGTPPAALLGELGLGDVAAQLEARSEEKVS
jgi:aldehyde:ferredoxin oxidoreductase